MQAAKKANGGGFDLDGEDKSPLCDDEAEDDVRVSFMFTFTAEKRRN